MNSATNRGSHRSARGFTLLETILAAVIGLLVIVAAMALFRVVDRSQVRSEMQMEQNNEFAAAHKTISRALGMLLMSDEQPPNERDTDEFLKQDDERNSADRAEEIDEEAASSRLTLQPDLDNPVVMLIGVEGKRRPARGQYMQVTLRDTPVLDSGEKTPDQQLAEQIRKERVLMRAQERLGKRFGGGGKAGASDRAPSEREASSSRNRSGSGSSLDNALDLANRATGQDEGSERDRTRTSDGRRISLRDRDRESDDRTASERLDDQDEERPRAPGVRGRFEILPDDQEVDGGIALYGSRIRRASTIDPSVGPTYSLWWRELPAIEIDAGSDPTILEGDEPPDDNESDNAAAALSESSKDEPSETTGRARRERSRSASERARLGTNSSLDGASVDRQVEQLARNTQGTGKRVRLLSGLTTCHWTAFRGRKERDKITAKFDRHLPAFIELEIVTAGGRRENWMFDVAWMSGPEPGSITPESPDALNNPAGPGETPAPVDTNGDGVIDGNDVQPKPNDPTGKPGDPTDKPGIDQPGIKPVDPTGGPKTVTPNRPGRGGKVSGKGIGESKSGK